MPKMKTHSGAKKRFSVTGTGKVMRQRANRRHLLEDKSSTRTRRLAGTSTASPARRQEGQAPPRHLTCPPDLTGSDTKEHPVARVKRAVNAHKKRRDDPRARQRLPRTAVAAVPQGEGAGHPLARLRLPRPQEAQGRLPPAVDPAHQRRCPRERHDVQPLHPGAQGRRRRGGPQACSPTSRSATPPRSPRSSRSPARHSGRRQRAGRLTTAPGADRDPGRCPRAARGSAAARRLLRRQGPRAGAGVPRRGTAGGPRGRARGPASHRTGCGRGALGPSSCSCPRPRASGTPTLVDAARRRRHDRPRRRGRGASRR